MRGHAELIRRYHPTDWVSEYQRLWAIFNNWLTTNSVVSSDRDKLNNLKTREKNKLDKWTTEVMLSPLTAITKAENNEISLRYHSESLISELFKSVQKSRISSEISYIWRTARKPVEPISALTIEPEALIKLKEIYNGFFSSETGIIYPTSLNQALDALDIGMTGSLFYRRKASEINGDDRKFAWDLLAELKKEPALDDFVKLIEAPDDDIAGISEDVIELLYAVRNCAMHGDLDFLIEEDNRMARASFDLLEDLLQNIITAW